jgi:hypothetical protein
LKATSGGLLGFFGFFAPSKLLAFPRNRLFRRCEPESSPPCSVKAISGDFYIDFPDESPVFGGGGFFAWGTTKNKNIFATRATCAGFPGSSIHAPGSLLGSGATGNGWAYVFDNVGSGVQVTLTIEGEDRSSMMPPYPAAKKGTFTFTTSTP